MHAGQRDEEKRPEWRDAKRYSWGQKVTARQKWEQKSKAQGPHDWQEQKREEAEKKQNSGSRSNSRESVYRNAALTTGHQYRKETRLETQPGKAAKKGIHGSPTGLTEGNMRNMTSNRNGRARQQAGNTPTKDGGKGRGRRAD